MYLKTSKYFINTVCISVTLVLVGFWIHRFFLNEDSSVIESRYYFDDKDDVFPVMSLCFKQTFNEEFLKSAGHNFTSLDYEKFLQGKYFNPALLQVDYHAVTTNVTEFVLGYDVCFRNLTCIENTRYNVAWKPLYYTISWNSWSGFVKCFGLEITEPNIYFVRAFIKREIFPDMIRDSNGGFAVLFHYPNQSYASLQSVKRQWIKRDSSTNHYMSFNIKGMEVNIQRYKKKRPNCVQNWRNYDNITLTNHLSKVGCKIPYQLTNDAWPICNNTEKMRAAYDETILMGGTKLRPCRVMESIDYDYGESEDTAGTGYWNRYWKNWIGFSLRILNPRFQVTIQRKDVDVQTLVGYIGGYIGIFTGFSITQIPGLLYSAAVALKKCLVVCRNKQRNQHIAMEEQ